MNAILKGVKEMERTLKEIARQFPDRVAAAIYTEAQIVMTESKRRCPVAPGGGTLRASGKVHEPVRRGRNISVMMSYGGAASAYAIAVHETPSDYDPPSWRMMYDQGGEIDWTSEGTGPKFLEGPINEAMPEMAARIGQRIHLERAKP